MEASHSFMDQHRSELHKSNWRMGKVLVDSGVKVFQIETTLNTNTSRRRFSSSPSGSGSGPEKTGRILPRDRQVVVAGAGAPGPEDPPLDRGAAPR